MRLKYFDSLPSTNSYLRENHAEESPFTMIVARNQTSGRGQRGNSWESMPGMNLTFSFYFNPVDILPRNQFVISEAVALAVVDALGKYGIEACVKWPNDIYVGNKKICGILIEHAITAISVMRTVAGVGINVNQSVFFSDAPNPVSMANLLGKELNLEEVAQSVGESLDFFLAKLDENAGREELHQSFMSKLWRGDGNYYPFRIPATEEIFSGRIADVLPTGMMKVEKKDDDSSLLFAFKEVEFVI